jgi:hypothetical protein
VVDSQAPQGSQIVWHRPISGNRPNHCSISPLGNYLVVSWYGTIAANLAAEEARSDNTAAGVRAYNWRTNTHKALSVLGEHSDMAVDDAGNEWFYWITFHGDNGSGGGDGRGLIDGRIVGCRIDNPTIVANTNIKTFEGSGGVGGGYHMSGAMPRRPGWMVFGKYAGVGGEGHDGQIGAFKVGIGTAKTIRFMHHRSDANGYWGEPQAVPNWDGTRIVFRSDWGSGSIEGEDYEIQLPSDWSTR